MAILKTTLLKQAVKPSMRRSPSYVNEFFLTHQKKTLIFSHLKKNYFSNANMFLVNSFKEGHMATLIRLATEKMK